MLAVNGSELSTSPTGSFIPRARAPETRCTGGRADPTACLGAVENRNISCSYKQLNHNSSVIKSTVYLPYRPKNPSFSIISIVTRLRAGYGVQFLAGARNLFLLHNVQTGSDDHQDSHSKGNGASFPREKQLRHYLNHSPHPVLR